MGKHTAQEAGTGENPKEFCMCGLKRITRSTALYRETVTTKQTTTPSLGAPQGPAKHFRGKTEQKSYCFITFCSH